MQECCDLIKMPTNTNVVGPHIFNLTSFPLLQKTKPYFVLLFSGQSGSAETNVEMTLRSDIGTFVSVCLSLAVFLSFIMANEKRVYKFGGRSPRWLDGCKLKARTFVTQGQQHMLANTRQTKEAYCDSSEIRWTNRDTVGGVQDAGPRLGKGSLHRPKNHRHTRHPLTHKPPRRTRCLITYTQCCGPSPGALFIYF